jgi:signal transduction histidine kinase/ligand-binding sensor domain-containing protein
MRRLLRLRRWVLAVLVLVPSSYARAADSPLADYTVTTWTEIDGLPTGRIRAIQQDLDGYLWLATESALVRFDGVRFETCNSLGRVELATGMVPLLATRDHSLWTAVAGPSPVARIRNGHTTLYGPGDGYFGTNVLSLLEDRDGTVWATSFQGLFRLQNGRWQHLGEADGLPDGSVLAVYDDSQHALWVATPSGVYRRPADHPRFDQVDKISVSSNVWHGFAEDAQGGMWMSDFRHGFRQVGSNGDARRQGWGIKLLRDAGGTVWVGTQGQGLWRVRDAGRAASPVVERITADEGLSSDAIMSLFEDREGNLWVGTNAGLHRLAPHHVTQVKQLPVARAIERTPDGSIWVGAVGGLTRFTEDGVRRFYSEPDGLQGSVVLALHAAENGDLWIATERGVSRFSNNRFSPVIVPAGDAVQRVFTMASANDTVWMRDLHARIFKLRNGEATLATDLPNAARRAPTALQADRHGNMWIGTGFGTVTVAYVDGTYRTFTLDIGNVNCLVEDDSGAMWVGGGRGLGRVVGDQVSTITQGQGFPGTAKAIVEDSDGALWVGGGTGIIRLERGEFDRVVREGRQLRYRLFNTTDGVAGTPVSDGSHTAGRAPDGRLWFATSGGVTVVDPHRIGEPRATAPARIETVATETSTFSPAVPFTLPPRTSHLQIAFTALALSDPGRVRFRYRLDGFDRGWVDAGNARHASYANLPPGQYTFHVAASTTPGAWTTPATALEFGIEPAIYQTRWFYALCALLVAGLVAAAWQLRVQQVRRQFALVLAERIRMSRAIHDTLLQGLAALALQIDDLSHTLDSPSPGLKNRLLHIRKRIEEDVRQARQSIFDLRSPRLEGGLLQAIRETAERTEADWPLKVDVKVNGTPQPSDPTVQEQVLHICQEALNNAVHHGRASRVDVEIDYADDRLRLRVTDDGCGFDPDVARAAGNRYGLLSMRERAEQVRGRLTIASAPGQGTKIETVVPIA